MGIHSRGLRAATLCLSTLSLGCSLDSSTDVDRFPGAQTYPPDTLVLKGEVRPRALASRARQGTVSFTIGPLVISEIEQEFPGHNWHLRDVQLSGSVSGDLAGEANLALNANLDGVLGSGPAWGTVSLVTTAGEIWQGSLTGSFRSGLPAIGIQLLSRVVLHGPDQQQLQAECDETTATSETLVCTGQLTSPHE